MDQDPVVQRINDARKAIKDGAAYVKHLADAAKHPERSVGSIISRDNEDRAEMIANLMLAYRHLEDASMRLGKAIQARDGGTSVYDTATTVGA
jgi:hypothetical protein